MKRISNKELNHENWDDEETPEERGTFSTAASDVISKRKVITVKRKAPVSQSGIFKSLSGFNTNFPSTLVAASNDNREKHLNNLKMLNKTFLEKIEKFVNENSCCILSPLFDDYQRHLNTIKTKYPLTNSNPDSTPLISTISKPIVSETIVSSPNVSVANVTSPSLTGMFNFNKVESHDVKTKPLFSFSSKTQDEIKNVTKEPFSFSLLKSDDTPKQSQFSFNNTAEKVQMTTSSMFSGNSSFTFASNVSKPQEKSLFGNSANATTPQVSSTVFNLFGSNKNTETSTASVFPTFLATNTAEVANVNNDDEEYVPPKAETRDIKEADSVFDIRCKLFYQIDQAWKEKGVGNIFIKPLSDGKFQLVMRADNSLGTILLNVLINKSMPLSVTKNNLSIIAMTDFIKGETKLTPLLIRVKTAADAEELLKVMKSQLE